MTVFLVRVKYLSVIIYVTLHDMKTRITRMVNEHGIFIATVQYYNALMGSHIIILLIITIGLIRRNSFPYTVNVVGGTKS